MNGFEKRTAAKKEQIVAATFDLMKASASGDFAMEEVAEKAGVSKTSIFKYFGTKEQLKVEVFRQYIETIRSGVRKIIDLDRPYEETMAEMLRFELDLVNQSGNSFYLSLMSYMSEKGSDGLSRIMEDYVVESYHMMLDLFHRGRKEGKVDWHYSDEFLMMYFQTLAGGISNPGIYQKMLPYSHEWIQVVLQGLAPREK
ncbi:TetR/AcrR family transcriptional regulator [Enterococcus nangangensis]|uniref:TetR/AcrR family transcriptional regulator n=1 Tax=Enterococcus nangangensis TaxID=2559926 RepID=UPI0010F4E8A8|nr:TetR/AcrR family transcriptional regulator [Enterococcus nangangensis]